MKRFFPIILFIMSLLIILTLASCNNQTENELNLSNVESEISEIENNENQSQQDESVEDPNDSAKNFEFVLLSDETYGIKKLLNTTATDLTIPEHYNGKAVTRIMKSAFSGASNLITLTIKDNIKEIEKGALAGCSSLKNITLPFIGTKQSSNEPLGFIFGTDFYSGSQKAEQNYEISNGLVKYDNFYIPSNLEKVTVTSGKIHMYAFMNCRMIEEVVLEDGVTTIESGAFFFCDALETVSMGKSITEISDECFRGLTNLKNVQIGEKVTKIGYYAFDGCTALKSIVIPKKVTVIEKYAFDCCTGMESIIFENTSGWYRDYGNVSGTEMNVTDPVLNVKNLTDSREYSSDRWKRR